MANVQFDVMVTKIHMPLRPQKNLRWGGGWLGYWPKELVRDTLICKCEQLPQHLGWKIMQKNSLFIELPFYNLVDWLVCLRGAFWLADLHTFPIALKSTLFRLNEQHGPCPIARHTRWTVADQMGMTLCLRKVLPCLELCDSTMCTQESCPRSHGPSGVVDSLPFDNETKCFIFLKHLLNCVHVQYGLKLVLSHNHHAQTWGYSLSIQKSKTLPSSTAHDLWKSDSSMAKSSYGVLHRFQFRAVAVSLQGRACFSKRNSHRFSKRDLKSSKVTF